MENIFLKIQKYGGYWFGHLLFIKETIIRIEDWLNNKGRPTWSFRQTLAKAIHLATGNSIFYLKPEDGNDANDGSTWALAWKTITSGATALKDICRKVSAQGNKVINQVWELSISISLS